MITRRGEWLGHGWLRALRSGESQQGALARESEIRQLRADIDAATRKEQSINEALTLMRDKLLEAEQHREDAQRALYLNHRSVSELAGQLQGSQSRLSPRRRASVISIASWRRWRRPWTKRRRRRASRARAWNRPSPAWANWKRNGSSSIRSGDS